MIQQEDTELPEELFSEEEVLPTEEIVLVNDTVPNRLDKFLLERLPGKTRAYVQKLIKGGHVKLGSGKQAKPSTKVVRGETVRVRIPRLSESTIRPKYVPFEVLYEDEDIVALNKPPGIAVHPSPGLSETTLVHGLLWRLKNLSRLAGHDRPGIVHRLDRDTSGVMIVAKNDAVHHRLSLKFKAREMHKAYVAICQIDEPLEAGVVDMPIGRSLRNRRKMAIRYDSGRPAITEYRIREVLGPFAIVDAFPRSGRTHQIRVHLSFMGMPIVCDQLYGTQKAVYLSGLLGKSKEPDEEPLLARQALHSRSLCFAHPRTGKVVRLEATLPEDMLRFIGHLRRLFPSQKPESYLPTERGVSRFEL